MTPTRVLALVLSISCAFLLGREFARRGHTPEPPGPGYDGQVASAHRAQAALTRASAISQNSTFIDVADRLRPSVVSIHGRSESSGSSGTGIIISTDGAILTNHHVVDGLEEITVTLSSFDRYTATIMGADEPTDLAVLKIEGVTGLLPATFGDSDTLRVAEDVLAIGNAFGLGWTVTRGIVSSLHRSEFLAEGRENRSRMRSGPEPYTDYIQTDASINFGNSGGPIVNAKGEVVGVSTAILSRPSEGIGFAIPANDARFVAAELRSRGEVRRGYLGLQAQDLSELPNTARRKLAPNAAGGIVVRKVEPGTPAESAGVTVDDVILALDGRAIESFQVLRNRVARTAPGTEVALRIIRAGEERELRAQVGEFPNGR
jgi:S1-C subfamily serine protease